MKKRKLHKPKILLFDIETAPNLGYVWGRWQQDVLEFTDKWYILCFSYKWLHEKKIHARALPDYPRYQENKQDDADLIFSLWELFDEADIIIGHNGDAFDIKKSNARFAVHGYKPPSPYISIDTLKVARKHFKFDSNKLDVLGQELGVGRKLAHTGWKLWQGCIEGDPKAWKTMVRYNKRDVELLEAVYYKLRPWMTNHPNFNTFAETSHQCPTCGSSNCIRRGFRRTRTTKKHAYQCKDCGSWSQGRTNLLEDPIDIR